MLSTWNHWAHRSPDSKLRLPQWYSPQVTGLAISLGTIVSGAVLTQMVFSYPGLGYLMVQAIKQNDYFLIQGCFLFLIVMVLLANFAIDIIYMLIDPRVRHSYSGEV